MSNLINEISVATFLWKQEADKFHVEVEFDRRNIKPQVYYPTKASFQRLVTALDDSKVNDAYAEDTGIIAVFRI